MDNVLTLFLCHYPSPVSSSRLGSQAWEILFGHILSLARSHKLSL
jgi:hypothetical protein